jgi:hypothetical protein
VGLIFCHFLKIFLWKFGGAQVGTSENKAGASCLGFSVAAVRRCGGAGDDVAGDAAA